MSKKVFNLVQGCVAGAQVIAVTIVAYCCEGAVAASINASVVIVANAALAVCEQFVKE